MFAIMQETVRADLAANQECLKADLSSVRADISSVKANQENVRTDISSVKAALPAIQNVKADLAINQENVKIELSKIRKDIRTENKVLVRKFEAQNQQTKKDLTEKLQTESRRLTNLVSQVRKKTEAVLLGAKRQLQSVSFEFEARTVQVSNYTQSLVEEYRSEISGQVKKLDQEIKKKLDENLKNQQERQKKDLNIVNTKIVALENKVAELPRPSVVTESSTALQNLVPLSVVPSSDLNHVSVSPDENRTCSCQTTSCNVCMNQNVGECRMQVADSQQASSFLSSSDLPLPLFNEGKDNNPVYHFRQLDDFMKFTGVPKALQLAVAYRSVEGVMSRQWVETACGNLTHYSEIKRAFLNICCQHPCKV
jgi:hypothetical protein